MDQPAMHVQQVLLQLSLIPGVGAGTVERLVKMLTHEQLAVLADFELSDFVARKIPRATAELIIAGLKNKTLLEAELRLLEKHTNIRLVTLFDHDYPELARHIHAPAPLLYVQGKLPKDYTRSLAVVGSRNFNAYGQQVVERLVPELVQDGFMTVSGGARGIDTLVHEATLRAGGVTIAVIGSGLLVPYPVSNSKLFQKIAHEGGAVVSTFPLLMEALPGNFPARNRIIAGIARGCLVVQAAAKSGALITAACALKEGREVCAVPGSIFDPVAAGCHSLLAQGATLVQKPEDIKNLYGIGDGVGAPPHHMLDVQKQLFEPARKLTLLEFCATPQAFDRMLEHEGCTQEELYDKLWELQIAGHIEEVASGMWLAQR